MEIENAVMVWPDGKENLSGGKTWDQQCGSSWQGRGSWLSILRILKTKILAMAATPAAPTAETRCGPPYAARIMPSAYHSQPSPMRVRLSIKKRIQRGAFQ